MEIDQVFVQSAQCTQFALNVAVADAIDHLKTVIEKTVQQLGILLAIGLWPMPCRFLGKSTNGLCIHDNPPRSNFQRDEPNDIQNVLD